MNKGWQVGLAFLVVFLAGGAIGSVFTIRYGFAHVWEKPAAAIVPSGELPAPQNFNAQLLRNWINTRKLALTPEERQKIMPILNQTNEDLNRLVRENSHSALLIMEHMQDEVAAMLPPAQRERFLQMVQNQRALVDRAMKARQRRSLLQIQQQEQKNALPAQ